MNQIPPDLHSSRKHTALIFVQAKPELFRCDFAHWLGKNWHVYLEFERRARRLWDAGRRHYGARSIWETMRYDSSIGELKGQFKLNDHWPPYVAQLFMLMNAQCDGMFERRTGAVALA